MQISFAEGREQNQVFMDFAHLSIRRNTRSTAIAPYRVVAEAGSHRFPSFPRSSVGMPTAALQRRMTAGAVKARGSHAGAWEPEEDRR